MRHDSGWKLSAVLLALLTLCGCGLPAGSGVSEEKHQVTLVAKSSSTEFWKSVFAGASAAATEYNLSLNVFAPTTEEDDEFQNRLVAQAVSDGAEVLIFSAIDYESSASAIDHAAAGGTRIIAIDSDVDSQAVTTYIGTDNYAAGQQAAQAALASGYDRLFVGLVNYDVNSANGQERERGVRETLAGRDDVTIVAGINVLAAPENAQAGTAELLQSHPEINVLIAFNEPTSVGAARAVRELKRSDTTWLVGFDSNVETIDMLQSGEVDTLIVQNPYAMGYLGVESAYRLLTGQGGELEDTVDTSTTLVNRDNLFSIDTQKALFAFE